MFGDIYPLERLPRAIGPFTYQLGSPELREGSWTRIPFRGRIIDGIVWARREHAPPGIKKILTAEVHPSGNALDEHQRNVIAWVSARYYVSPAVALSAFIPEPPKRGSSILPSEKLSLHLTVKKSRNLSIQGAVAELPQGRSLSFFLLRTLSERATAIAHVARQYSTQQVLVLVPTRFEAQRLWSTLTHQLDDRTILLHRGMSKTAYWDAWSSIGKKGNALVITTKHGLGAPFRNLACVVVDLEADDSHKQAEQNPRYDARVLAQTIAQSHEVPVVFLDAQPSLATSVLPDLRFPSLLTPDTQNRLLLHRQSEMTYLDRMLPEKTREVVEKNAGPILFLYNRRGIARALSCADCGWMLLCTQCATPLVLRGTGTQHCQRCGTDLAIPTQCPRCRGPRLQERGKGTEGIVTLLQRVFPSRRVERFDRDSDALPANVDLLVATERILSVPVLPAFRAIVILHVEQLLQYPDFRVAERAYLLLEHLTALAAPDAPVIFQTDNPDQPLLRALIQQKRSTLYDEELALRSTLQYPPSSRVLKVLGMDVNEAVLEETAQQLRVKIEEALTAPMRVLGPLTPAESPQGKFSRFFLIQLLSHEDEPDKLRTVLASLPEQWFVDADPESFA